MKLQSSCKQIMSCQICDQDIYKTEKRLTDGGLHYHFMCKPEIKREKTFMERFVDWLGR